MINKKESSEKTEFLTLARVAKKSRVGLYVFLVLLSLCALIAVGLVLYQKRQAPVAAEFSRESRTLLNDVTLYAQEGEVMGLAHYGELKLVTVGPAYVGKIPKGSRFYADLGRFLMDKYFAVDKVTGSDVYLKPIDHPHRFNEAGYQELRIENLTWDGYGKGGGNDWKPYEAKKAHIAVYGKAIRKGGEYYLTWHNKHIKLENLEKLSAGDKMKLRFAAGREAHVKFYGQIANTFARGKERNAKDQKLFAIDVHTLTLP